MGLLSLLALREKEGHLVDDLKQSSDPGHVGLRGTLLVILLASLAGLPPFAGFWASLSVMRSLLSISVPAENGFLPHQNVDYVVVAIVAAGGLILIAAIVLGLVMSVLFDERDTPWVNVLNEVRNGRTISPERSLLAVSGLAALAVVLLGAFPGPAMRFAAWGTAADRAVSRDSADRAAAPSTSRKSHRARRAARGGLEQPDDDEP